MRIVPVALAALLAAALPGSLTAQSPLFDARIVGAADLSVAPEAGVEPAAPIAPETARAEGVIWTLLGAAVGTAAGGWLGYEIDHARDVPSENPGLFGMLLGGMLGSTAGSALGAHLGAEGEGSLGRRLLISTAVAALGAGLIAATEDGVQTGFAISIPVGQVLALSF